MSTELNYIGDELTIFALAKNWKAYFSAALTPFIRGEVAEPGAGLGKTTLALCDPAEKSRWLCVEPDRTMADGLLKSCAEGGLPARCTVHHGVLADLPADKAFDTVIYIDVIEHVEDDQGEFEAAAARLRPGGRVVVLAPAWQHLYSPFDKRIGHFRRYSRASLTALRAPGLRLETSFYLDSVGYFASLANRLLLKQGAPVKSQILLWDNVMVRASRVLDPLILRSVGRSVIAVWIRDNGR
jgi:SAM-dependent methyltransferase